MEKVLSGLCCCLILFGLVVIYGKCVLDKNNMRVTHMWKRMEPTIKQWMWLTLQLSEEQEKDTNPIQQCYTAYCNAAHINEKIRLLNQMEEEYESNLSTKGNVRTQENRLAICQNINECAFYLNDAIVQLNRCLSGKLVGWLGAVNRVASCERLVLIT